MSVNFKMEKIGFSIVANKDEEASFALGAGVVRTV
jgi:hypothetical protein